MSQGCPEPDLSLPALEFGRKKSRAERQSGGFFPVHVKSGFRSVLRLLAVDRGSRPLGGCPVLGPTLLWAHKQFGR